MNTNLACTMLYTLGLVLL